MHTSTAFPFSICALSFIAWLTLCGHASAIEPEELAGKWEWLHATLPHDGGRQTPATEGYTMTLTLRADGSYSLL